MRWHWVNDDRFVRFLDERSLKVKLSFVDWYEMRETYIDLSKLLLFKSPGGKVEKHWWNEFDSSVPRQTDGYWYHFSLSGSHLLFICLLNEICSKPVSFKSRRLHLSRTICPITVKKTSRLQRPKIIRVFKRTADDKTKHDNSVCRTHLIRFFCKWQQMFLYISSIRAAGVYV